MGAVKFHGGGEEAPDPCGKENELCEDTSRNRERVIIVALTTIFAVILAVSFGILLVWLVKDRPPRIYMIYCNDPITAS